MMGITNYDNRLHFTMFKPDSIRSLFWCFDENTQVESCCSFLNTFVTQAPSKDVKSKNVPTFGLKVRVNKRKFKSKDSKTLSKSSKASSSAMSSDTRVTRSKSPNSAVIKGQQQFDQAIENVANALKSFQYQVQQQQQSVAIRKENNDVSLIKPIETSLQALYWDTLNLNNLIPSNSKKSVKDESSSENQKPSTSKPKSANSVKEKLVSNSYFILRLFHFECNLIKCFQTLEAMFDLDISILLSTESFAGLFCKINNICRAYYSLLNKLPILGKVKTAITIHSSSKRNSATILTVLARTILNREVISSEEEVIEIETSSNSSKPEIRLKKQLKTPKSSIDTNKCVQLILVHLEFLAKKDFFVSKFDVNQTLDQVKMEQCTINRQKTLEFAMESSLVSILRDFLSQFVDNFKNKSLSRQKTIELLAILCLKRKGILDSVTLGSNFIQTLFSLLTCLQQSHTQTIFREHSKTLHLLDLNTPQMTSKKDYLSILREIYGLLSILLSFTEVIEGQECLQFHNVAENLYSSFLQPFVEMLNGTEDCDPQHLKVSEPKNYKNDPGTAYKILKNVLKEHQKMHRLLDRIVGISSIIVQRLLPALLIPNEAKENPFTFDIPGVETKEEKIVIPKAKKISQDDVMNLDENQGEDQASDDDDMTTNIVANSSEVQESSVSSYLHFFPERSDLSMENNDKFLCNCSTSFTPPTSPVIDSSRVYENLFYGSKEWNSVFSMLYGQTASVTPKPNIPFPEANFLYDASVRNQPLQPMTYPFLDQLVQKKNYHYIKSADQVQNRFGPKQQLLKVFDNQTALPVNEQYLVFDSHFECGNLRAAMVVLNPSRPDEEEYHLILNSDVNTLIHTQWFYFSVQGAKTDKRYRFKIINLQKKSILYNSGQQPAFYSVEDFHSSQKMWQRIGESSNVAYYRNHYVRSEAGKLADKFYTLEFNVEFKNENDTCYFAYNIPYSFTFLKTNIAHWLYITMKQNGSNSGSSDENTSFIVNDLCSTLKGNNIPVLTITSNKNVQSSRRPHYVFVTARVHPSESNSSWIMKGFIDFLLINSPDAKQEAYRRRLLDNYIFKIVPMLNPDGVINGGTRTGLQKVDLNRQWANPHPLLHPTIYHTKMLLKCINYYSKGLNPVAFIDLHGHSRQKNIFSYSCSPFMSWKKSDRTQAKKFNDLQHHCLCTPTQNTTCTLPKQISTIKNLSNSSVSLDRYHLIPPYIMLPYILHELKAPCFNTKNCTFNVQLDRESSGRIVAWRQFEIPLSYTFECSASGVDVGPFAGYHLDISHLEDMGSHIANSFNNLHFLLCSNKHIPVVVLPKSSEDAKSGLMSTNAKIQELLKKSNKRGIKDKSVNVKLIDMYPELNSNIYPPASPSSSISGSQMSTPSSSKTTTPAKKCSKKSMKSVK